MKIKNVFYICSLNVHFVIPQLLFSNLYAYNNSLIIDTIKILKQVVTLHKNIFFYNFLELLLIVAYLVVIR